MAPLQSPRGVSEDSARTAKKKKKGGVNSPKETTGGYAGEGGPRDAGPSQGARSAPTSPRVGQGSGAPPLAASPSIRPNSAFGQQYTGAFYPNAVANPEVLAGNWMGSQGITPQGGGGSWAVYQDLARNMPQLFYLTQGQNGTEGLSMASFLDYANQYLNQMSTPGAGTISPNAAGSLFNSSLDTPLGKMLNNPDLDPEQQASLLLSLLDSAVGSSLMPGVASAYMGEANAKAQQWADQKYQGKGGTFQDYLANSGFADLFR